MDKVEIGLPYDDKVVKRSIRKDREVLIFGIKYKVPENVDLDSIISYEVLEVVTDFEDILVLALEKASKSSELTVQIFEVDMIDLYNIDFPSTYSLTLDCLVDEAKEVYYRYTSSGNSLNEDLYSNDKNMRKRAKKDIRYLEKYINRFEMVAKLLKKNNKYKELSILETEVENAKYMIYPSEMQEEVIRMKPKEILNDDRVITV